jgi:uncharacterized protein YndB with AHSA1/START domain
MSVISVEKDFDSLTVTLIADFDASIERVWQLWADPRQLERWWGPPSHPATFEEHNLTPGGAVSYYMTGPGGERSRAWWQVMSVNPPASLEFVDGFADQDGTPLAGRSTITIQVTLTDHDSGTRMVVRSVFDSREQLEQLERMGAVEVFVQTVGQMDALLAG